jgi:hypothetical protein
MSPELPSPLKPKSTNTQGKPVLDERSFQGLLAAVYMLQEHHDRQIEHDREANCASFRDRELAANPITQRPAAAGLVASEQADRGQGPNYEHRSKEAPFISVTRLIPTEMNNFPRRLKLRPRWRSHQLFGTMAVGATALLFVVLAALWIAPVPRLSPWSSRAARLEGKNARMTSAVKARIHADPRLRTAPVLVESSDGIITLSGNVSSGAERVVAAQVASKVDGVKVVIDNLRVIDPNPQGENVATRTPIAEGSQDRGHDFHAAATIRVPASDEASRANFSGRTRAPHANVGPSGSLSAKTRSIDSKTSGVGTSAPNASPPAVAIRTSEQVTVPYGTVLSVKLKESLNSNLNQPGDIFLASLASPLMVGNKVVVPAEAAVQGKIVEVRNAGRFNGSSALVVKVIRLAYNGKTYDLRSSQYAEQGATRSTRTVEMIGGGAGVGAILGVILGGQKGAAIGAVIGAGVGTGARAMSKTTQVRLPVHSTLSFRLESPLTVIPSSILFKNKKA